uniref:G-protein coupled receptors family 1 profile domain-containing protein n=1 Tax=Anolis carolinensis TaxID=28377 RepID=A0A803T2G6_ANOCA
MFQKHSLRTFRPHLWQASSEVVRYIGNSAREVYISGCEKELLSAGGNCECCKSPPRLALNGLAAHSLHSPKPGAIALFNRGRPRPPAAPTNRRGGGGAKRFWRGRWAQREEGSAEAGGGDGQKGAAGAPGLSLRLSLLLTVNAGKSRGAGIVSLISLAILSYERYSTLTQTNKRGSDYQKALLGVGGSWLYSLIWTVPPLIGWSSYGLEGAGTSCSVRWTSETLESVTYIICLFIFCLAIPVLVMIYCYARLFYAVKQVGKLRKTSARKREFHVLFMIITTIICYLICWMPYGVIALLATFGRPGLVSPVASVIPSILAKSSTVFNPIIYILMNKQFYKCFLMLLHCQPSSVADGETICQSKVMAIHQNQKAQGGVILKSQVVPQMDEKAICLLSPESSLDPVLESTPQLSKENSFL